MAVVGIDFGNHSCYVSVARAGGIESIANDYSQRDTPSYVGFTERQRLMGVAAKNQLLTNLKKTVFDFKHMIGRRFSDPVVQEVVRGAGGVPYDIEEGQDGRPRICVADGGSFTPEEVTAMLLTKLRIIAEEALRTQVRDVVISCPGYFGDCQRRALLDAASMAGLNVLKLMNDTTATALAYGIYKQDLPGAEEKPRNVIFVDAGHVGVQVAACSFNKGKLVVKSYSHVRGVGGKELDAALVRYFSEDFRSKHGGLDPMGKPRPRLKLTTEVEKVKKQMSANTNKLPLNVECFMEEKDLKHRVDREAFEEMAADKFTKIEEVLRECLKASELKKEDIYAVEVVGGSTRIPAIKAAIEKVYGMAPKTTLNSDEAVSRGCALQCAILSPTFRVREFSVTDLQPAPIKLKWKDHEDLGEMVVFPKFHPVPFSKLLTFYRREAFVLEAEYDTHPSSSGSEQFAAANPYIGSFEIGDVKPAEDGSSHKVKVKVRVNLNGVFSVHSATLLEKHEVVEEVPMDVDAAATDDKDKEDRDKDKEVKGEEAEAEGGDGKDAAKKKTTTVSKKTVDLPVTARAVGSLSRERLEAATEQERRLHDQDVCESERLVAKNSVEEYIYDIRGRINEELEEFVAEDVRSGYSCQLEDVENWLYEEGEYLDRSTYAEKLKELKLVGEAAKKRKTEFDGRKAAVEALGHSLQMAGKAVDAFRSGDEAYAHLDASEVEKVTKLAEEKKGWMERSISALERTDRVTNPPVLICQFYSEKESFENISRPILNKPKPKVEAPPPPPEDGKEPPSAGGEEGTKEDETKKAASGGEQMETSNPEVNGGGGNQQTMDLD